MNDIKHISSIQNSLIKTIVLLKDKSRERKKKGVFVLEGKRELELAQKGNYQIQTILFYEDITAAAELQSIYNNLSTIELISITKEVYQKIAYRQSTEGVLAIATSKSHNLEDLYFDTPNPLILVAEAPEKPGNMGALLRTADAANLDAVIIANPKGDLYNPNSIRSSVGCIFTTQIATATTEEAITFLKEKNANIFCAALTASKTYTTVNYSETTAIVVGTEATGLSAAWLQNSSQNIIIPMLGEIDSMNVSVSAAIIIFEALRQRSL